MNYKRPFSKRSRAQNHHTAKLFYQITFQIVTRKIQLKQETTRIALFVVNTLGCNYNLYVVSQIVKLLLAQFNMRSFNSILHKHRSYSNRVAHCCNDLDITGTQLVHCKQKQTHYFLCQPMLSVDFVGYRSYC